MTITANFSAPYPPSLAESGKFVVLDSSTIVGYPSSYNNVDSSPSAVPTLGKYAILTYQTNPSNLILSSGNVTVSSVEVTNAVTIGTINDTITVDTIQTQLSTLELLPTTVVNSSLTLAANGSSVITYSPIARFIEIYNNSNGKIYFDYNAAVTYPNLTAKGMIVDADSYYGIDKNVTTLVVGTVSASDVRIFGHY